MDSFIGDPIMQQEISCMIFSVGSYGFQIPVAEFLKKNHDDPLASHGGIHKTLERVRRYYSWPGLVNDVKSYTQSCETCKSTKAPNRTQRPPMGVTPVSQRFFHRLYIEFPGPYLRSRSSNIGIFIVLDHYSKFVFLKAVKKFTAEVVIKYLQQDLFHTFGVPETIVSDNGSQFRAEIFQKLLREYSISHTLTAAYSPSQTHRLGLMSDLIRKIGTNSLEIFAALHSALGTSPYYVAFGQNFVSSGSSYKLLRALGIQRTGHWCFQKFFTRISNE